MANLSAIFTKIGQFQKVLARRISLWPETFFGQFVATLKNLILTKFSSGYLANLWPFSSFEVANFGQFLQILWPISLFHIW